MPTDRLSRQLAFLIEIDKLKQVSRRTPLADGSRPENSAEHTWHLIVCAMLLREYVAGPLDLFRTIQMLAIHDIVEIDAGDTFAYDHTARLTKEERERTAAARLFALLPPDQEADVHALWHEFEAMETIESRLANAVDRLQALLLNAASGGGSWRTGLVTRAQVEARMAPVVEAMPPVAGFVRDVIDSFSATGVIVT
jgi:putative hydrolase of HD superfamily